LEWLKIIWNRLAFDLAASDLLINCPADPARLRNLDRGSVPGA
jgi:hypothetical protein